MNRSCKKPRGNRLTPLRGAVTPVIRNTSLCKRHKVSHGVMSYRTKYNPLRIKLNVKVALDVERVGSEWILNLQEDTRKMVHYKWASLLP